MDGNKSFAISVNGHPRGSFPPQGPVPTAPVEPGSRTARELWLRYVHMAAIGTEFYQHLDPIVGARFEAEIAAGRWFLAVVALRLEATHLQLPLTDQFLTDPTPSLVAPGWTPTRDIRSRLIRFAGELTPLFDRSAGDFWLPQSGEQINDAEGQVRLASAVAEGVFWRLRYAESASSRADTVSSVGGNPLPRARDRTARPTTCRHPTLSGAGDQRYGDV
jgi:hypothetical protein